MSSTLRRALLLLAGLLAAGGLAAGVNLLLLDAGGRSSEPLAGQLATRLSTTTAPPAAPPAPAAAPAPGPGAPPAPTPPPPPLAAAPPASTTVPAPERRVYRAGDAGGVVLDVHPDRLELVAVDPHPGWAYDIEVQTATEIRVEFERDGADDVELRARIENGQLRVDIEAGDAPDD